MGHLEKGENMLKKLTKKDVKFKKVLNDRMAFHSVCYFECVGLCSINGLTVTNDYQLKADM